MVGASRAANVHAPMWHAVQASRSGEHASTSAACRGCGLRNGGLKELAKKRLCLRQQQQRRARITQRWRRKRHGRKLHGPMAQWHASAAAALTSGHPKRQSSSTRGMPSTWRAAGRAGIQSARAVAAVHAAAVLLYMPHTDTAALPWQRAHPDLQSALLLQLSE